MRKIFCRKCNNDSFWNVRRGKLRCKKCFYEFKPKIGGMYLPEETWKEIIRWFLRHQSADVISEETGTSKYKVLRATKIIRMVLANKMNSTQNLTAENTTEIIGIACSKNKINTNLLNKEEAVEAEKALKKRIYNKKALRKYAGIATRKKLLRIKKKSIATGRLENFYGHLKKYLLSKGGISKSKLLYYLSSLVWIYNHRDMSTAEQTDLIINYLSNYPDGKNQKTHK